MPLSVPIPLRAALRARLWPTVAQLVTDLAAQEFGGDGHVPATTDVVLRRVGGMAPHLGGGMVALTLAFDAGCRISGGPFHQLSDAQRSAMLDRWRRLPGPLGSWAVFYEKMSVFSYWAVVEEAAHAAAAGQRGEPHVEP